MVTVGCLNNFAILDLSVKIITLLAFHSQTKVYLRVPRLKIHDFRRFEAKIFSFENEGVLLGKYFPRCIHTVHFRQPRHITVCL